LRVEVLLVTAPTPVRVLVRVRVPVPHVIDPLPYVYLSLIATHRAWIPSTSYGVLSISSSTTRSCRSWKRS
jgi:hypothetical protein